VLPDANARQQPLPTITAKDTRPASECVTQIIPLKYASAAQLVPVLRPMLPPYAHLAAVLPGNALLIVDRFANVRRIEALVRSLDTPENQPPPRKEPER
jgi:general secretion pathway protein D